MEPNTSRPNTHVDDDVLYWPCLTALETSKPGMCGPRSPCKSCKETRKDDLDRYAAKLKKDSAEKRKQQKKRLKKQSRMLKSAKKTVAKPEKAADTESESSGPEKAADTESESSGPDTESESSGKEDKSHSNEDHVSTRQEDSTESSDLGKGKERKNNKESSKTKFVAGDKATCPWPIHKKKPRYACTVTTVLDEPFVIIRFTEDDHTIRVNSGLLGLPEPEDEPETAESSKTEKVEPISIEYQVTPKSSKTRPEGEPNVLKRLVRRKLFDEDEQTKKDSVYVTPPKKSLKSLKSPPKIKKQQEERVEIKEPITTLSQESPDQVDRKEQVERNTIEKENPTSIPLEIKDEQVIKLTNTENPHSKEKNCVTNPEDVIVAGKGVSGKPAKELKSQEGRESPVEITETITTLPQDVPDEAEREDSSINQGSKDENNVPILKSEDVTGMESKKQSKKRDEMIACFCGDWIARRRVRQHALKCPLTKEMSREDKEFFGKELLAEGKAKVACFLEGCSGLTSSSNYGKHFRPNPKSTRKLKNAHQAVYEAAKTHKVDLIKLAHLRPISTEQAVEEIKKRSNKLDPTSPTPAEITVAGAEMKKPQVSQSFDPSHPERLWVDSLNSPVALKEGDGSSLTLTALEGPDQVDYIPRPLSYQSPVDTWKTDKKLDRASTKSDQSLELMVKDMGWDRDSQFKYLLDGFFKYMTDNTGLIDKSAKNYRSKIDRLLSSFIRQNGNELWEILTEKGLLLSMEFVNGEFGACMKEKTKQTYFSALKRFTTYLLKKDLISASAATSVKEDLSTGIAVKGKAVQRNIVDNQEDKEDNCLTANELAQICLSDKWGEMFKLLDEDAKAGRKDNFMTVKGALFVGCLCLRSGRAGEPLLLTDGDIRKGAPLHDKETDAAYLYRYRTRGNRKHGNAKTYVAHKGSPFIYVTPQTHKVALQFIDTYARFKKEDNEQFLFSAETGKYTADNSGSYMVNAGLVALDGKDIIVKRQAKGVKVTPTLIRHSTVTLTNDECEVNKKIRMFVASEAQHSEATSSKHYNFSKKKGSVQATAAIDIYERCRDRNFEEESVEYHPRAYKHKLKRPRSISKTVQLDENTISRVPPERIDEDDHLDYESDDNDTDSKQ